MGGWWVAEAWATSPVLLASWIFWVIGSITLHELSHGWAAIRCGDSTPIVTGHMTPNPIVHMGQMSLLMFAIVGIAWGAMPVDPSRFRRRHDDALVAFAGPAMNLGLALVASVLVALWVLLESRLNIGDPFATNMRIFLLTGAWLNVVLLLFNLLPVPPLDGSRILASFAPSYARFLMTQQGQIAGLVVFIAIFWYGGDALFGAAQHAVGWFVSALISLVP